MTSTREEWVRRIIQTGLEVGETEVEECLSSQEGRAMLLNFLDKAPVGSSLLFFTQPNPSAANQPSAASAVESVSSEDGEFVHISSVSSVPQFLVRMCNDHLPEMLEESRSIFMIKNVEGAIRPPVDTEMLELAMTFAIEYGVISGHSLLNLERLLKDVFIPMVDPERDVGAGKVPLSSAMSQISASEKETAVNTTDNLAETAQNEFSGNMQKFVGQISHAIQQVTGNVRLPLPPIHTELSEKTEAKEMARLSKDPSIVSQLESTLEVWLKTISNIIESENRKKPSEGEGPMSEINFWRERNAALSAVYEQLKMEQVTALIRLMELAQITRMDNFKDRLQELMKLYVEAKDNVKFLTTLERHFKNISRGSLSTILETIPSMMNSLRMVWIISRHYNKDDRMFALMQLIAADIADKVARQINIRTIFRRKPADVMKTIRLAKEVLESWQSTYLTVRERIERSGTERRWEFGRKELFDQTTYMARICEELYDVAETLDQFNKFLGSRLKAVTGDPHGVEEVLARVKALVSPLENLPFNVFDRRYTSSWDSIMKSFKEKVKSIEQRTAQFIDTSFQKLRSAEGAFDLLQKNFNNLETRAAIQEQMMAKFTNILQQFGREVEEVRQIFEEGKHNPPISLNQPPVAGSIMWARSLYHRIKKSVLRFQTMDGLLSSEEGKVVCRDYVTVAKAITQYEAGLFNDWSCRVNHIASSRLKEYILSYSASAESPSATPVDPANSNANALKEKEANAANGLNEKESNVQRDTDGLSDAEADKNIRRKGPAANAALSSATSLVSEQRNADARSSTDTISVSDHPQSRGQLAGGRSFVSDGSRSAVRKGESDKDRAVRKAKEFNKEKEQKIVVNFSPELWQLIKETKYLERLGCHPIPEAAINLALQERKYYELVERLNAMLGQYEAVLARLSEVERVLLSRRIKELRKCLRPGFNPLNWNSLAIPDFIESCEKGIQMFENTVETVQKNAAAIRAAVWGIRNAKLYDCSEFNGRVDVMSVEELHDRLEKRRLATLDELGRKYKSIGPLLIIIEKVVCNSDTGMAPEMKDYYQHWETEMFVALTHTIVTAMHQFQDLLMLKDSGKPVDEKETPVLGAVKPLPLIKVTASMSAPHIIVSPNIQDIYKFLSKLLKNIPESAKHFVRWMDGTCKDCEPLHVSDEEEVLYTFWHDISKNPVVVKMMLSVTQSMQKVIHNVDKYVDSWKRYDRNYHLWNQKKLSALERLRSKTTPTSYFDQQLARYLALANDVDALASEKDVSFIRIDCFPLIVAIKKQAEVWSAQFGEMLRELAETQLRTIIEQIETLQGKISRDTADLNDLKYVLNAKKEIADSTMAMNLQFAEIAEKFRTLRMYNVPIKKGDDEIVDLLPDRWHELVLASRKRDADLYFIKKKFTEITKEQVLQFVQRATDLRTRFESYGPGNSNIELDEGLELMNQQRAELGEFTKEKESLVLAEKLFDLAQTSFTDLYVVEEEMQKLEALYDMYARYKESVKKWSAILWAELEVGTLTRGMENIIKECKKADKALQAKPLYNKISDAFNAFKESLPLLALLKNDSVRDRHWSELMERTGVKFEMDAKSFTLGKLFSMHLNRFPDLIQQICSAAMQEGKIEKDLQKLSKFWAQTNFPMTPYKGDESKGWLLQDCSEILLNLEDNAMSLQAMANSPFAAAFTKDIRSWETAMNLMTETIQVWTTVQRKFVYLQGIFVGSEDIRAQLPEAAKKFDRVDSQFKKIMVTTAKNPNVLKACQQDSRLEELRALSSELDLCQKSLSDYLERKRNAFPRFFFISDDELLSILGSSDPLCVQQHMMKLFENCKELSFVRGNTAIAGMCSSSDEKYDFRSAVVVDGKVENWMTQVESEMQRTLHQITKEAVFHYAGAKRLDWIHDNLGMVNIVGSQIWWTWEVEDVFRRVKKGNKHAMKQLATKLSAQLNELVEAIRDGSLRPGRRAKLNTLIIIDVHARDIIDRFVRDSILSATEFDWESQLRFYWDKDVDDIIVRQCTGEFSYGYEYQGLNGRLVITPLTDRCYMTLTQALTFHLGGSPAGPAGTGKTETVKDLAKALGLPCIVTNCGEGLDYKAMGSIFAGLVQTGAWGCFDEFNRIDVEVLSVVSSQLQSIQNAMNQKKTRFEFLNKEITMKPTVGFFITMNPGYSGRTELPDNLKALFRPVTMIVPDMLQICEIMLFSEGFNDARALAKKMTVLYKLASEQLSKQAHYDFGLRALKAVLVMAGALKRDSPEYAEELVLMRALRDMNLPKFVFEDVPLFLGLIGDLFPGLDCPRVQHKALKQAVVAELEEHGYKHREERVFDSQVDKVIQLYETMLTRHTTMVVGPTGGGKSVIIETLARAQNRAFKINTRLYPLNPKALGISELYGVLDPSTRDWTDGLLSKIFREVNEPLKPEQREARYIVFDGDVDAKWVENMNSVMDDNKLLTLPNGERIRLENHCKLLFEVADLQYASPATVSRCGMVYVDPKNLGYLPYYNKWLNSRCENDPKQNELLYALFLKYMEACVGFCLEGLIDGQVDPAGPLEYLIPITNIGMVQQFCALFSAIVPIADPKKDKPDEKAPAPAAGAGGKEEVTIEAPTDPDAIESLYIFCLIWSVGGNLRGPSRERFDAFLKKLSGRAVVQGAGKGHVPNYSLYDAFFDLRDSRWAKWESKVTPYEPPVPFKFSKILVPTVDTVRYSYLLQQMVACKKPVLFVGESGTAKTVVLQNYLDTLPADSHVTLNINFSSRTTSMDVQRTVEDNVEKRTGLIYGPKNGKQMVIFIDDLNMPKRDPFGTQQPIALLKFLMERGNMYDRSEDNSSGERLAKKSFRDIQYVGAMAPPGGGRNPVDPRFISLFNVFSITFPSADSLTRIYSSIINKHLENFPDNIQAMGNRMTDMTMKLYNQLIAQLPATPSKFHYVFNLRDLSRVYEGLCLATPDKFQTPVSFLRLWRNEAMRIFHDRLITPSDQKLVAETVMSALVKEFFPAESADTMANPLLFGDFRLVNFETENPKLYEDLHSYEEVRLIFNQVLEHYNGENSKAMNLVLFQDALEHLTRIHRILRLPRGNALLVGVGGSGKQSLTKLAAFAAGYRVFEISLTRSYGEADFREDLKKLYTMLGAEKGGGPVVFLFTDAHVKDENFLEMINNMLTSGMVPALYADDEKVPLADSCREEVTQRGIIPSTENCWKHFVNKCRDNLHVVLCMSPAGETLRRRCRNFPGLVSNTVIDWFFPWPESALLAVANHFLASEALPDTHRESIVQHIVKVHTSVTHFSSKFELELRRVNHVTPKNYLDYIQSYREQLKLKREENRRLYHRLEGGLQKLTEAAEAVAAFGEELKERKVVVDAKRKECSEMIAQIQTRSLEVSSKQKQAAESEAQLIEDNSRITYEKAEAEKALMEAEPALAEAAAALSNLKKEDISEVKVMPKPPEAVLAVCQCVLELKPTGTDDPSKGWAGAKIMMSDPNFLGRLKNYPRDDIKEPMIKKVKKILTAKPADPKQALTVDNLKRVSKAATGLYQWVLAIVNYNAVAKDVEPRRLKVKEMERAMAKSQMDLRRIKEELASLEAEISALNANLQEKSSELSDLEQKAEQMEKHLMAASRLIGGLGSERTRWGEQKASLATQEIQLVGDCLLAAAFLSYTGAFTYDYRKAMIHDVWEKDLLERKVPLSQPFKLATLLTTEVEISRWVGEGLPSDELSVQNGILTTLSSRWPLCIDPQMQASKWIKNREKNGRGKNKQKLEIRTFHDSDFMRMLELAIQFGKPFLFENIGEELDPIINPVLEKNFVTGPNGKTIQLGDNTVDYNEDFRLYMITKLSNPQYSPEVAAKTMLINYTVTMQGLEDQLLNEVVGHERADLQKQREALIQSISQAHITLVELEDNILRELNESTGNILENASLIAALEDAKKKSVSITQSLAESKSTAEEIEKVTDSYRPAAKRGAVLFFAMAGLSTISPMYEFSLSTYLEVFIKALDLAPRDALVSGRVHNIIDTLTKTVYDYTCTGIFEKHKLMFSMQMTSMILDADHKLDRQELDFFLKGNISLEACTVPKPAEWIPEVGWKDLQRLITMDPVFVELQSSVQNNTTAWKSWYDVERPEELDFPDGFSPRLRPFQKLNVLRCFRPDRVYNAVRNFVIQAMNSDYYVQPPVLQYERIWKQSSPSSPVVFILSPGADPQSSLQALATQYGFFPQRFKYLALGQGQSKIAEKMLEMGYLRGHWVILQNCHLLTSWLKTLEKLLESMNKPHPDFRLFLTTEPTEAFPLGILQRSLKVVTEPPDGLKLNMKGSVAKITQQELDECAHWAYRPLVYVLSFFHAVVQERRKYGKLGWNVAYDFNDSDFAVSRRLLSMYLTKAFRAQNGGAEAAGDAVPAITGPPSDPSAAGVIPWGSLRYLIGEAMYGGRVTDSFDRRILITYLDEYMGDFLFDDCQAFFFSRAGFDYTIPEWGPLDNYTKAVERLPLDNSPQVFGLHSNAEIRYNTNAVAAVWRDLINLQPRTAVGGGAVREEYIDRVAKDILSQVPEPFDLPAIRKKLQDRADNQRAIELGQLQRHSAGQSRSASANPSEPAAALSVSADKDPAALSPTTIVLLQELERWNRLVVKMDDSLKELQNALLGIVGMSQELDDLASALFNGFLPEMWRKLAPQTQKGLGAWMIHFQRRYKQYSEWVDTAEDPKVMWLSGLHVPESYLTALVQTTCRRKGWPLDKSTLFTEVTHMTDESEVKEKPADGCYITGLFLEGAAWDTKTHCLKPQDPKVLVVPLPILQVIPIEANKLKLQNTFRTPVYVTQNRRSAMGDGLVFEADLATQTHPSHWILQGTALTLNIDS